MALLFRSRSAGAFFPPSHFDPCPQAPFSIPLPSRGEGRGERRMGGGGWGACAWAAAGSAAGRGAWAGRVAGGAAVEVGEGPGGDSA